MITSGIIREINVDEQGYIGNAYKVEIPIFNSTSDQASYKTIVTSTACLPGGIYDCYHEGDYVYIGFVDNKFNYPVILGKIYKGLETTSCGADSLTRLKVAESVELPTNTSIGDINYNELLNTVVNSQFSINQSNYSTDWEEISVVTTIADSKLYKGTEKQIGTWADGNNLYQTMYLLEASVSAATSFSFEFTLPENIKYVWWDTSRSFIKEVGQPFYKGSNNNFCLELDAANSKGYLKGKLEKAITEIYACLTYTK